ncbi:hypothetical protein M5K25_024243 [Dendrobium thyrsiflorum]|uniref:Uncharacterized protein n=1 Tax=Dendrobium thyrsiflorum TaxID=117978 RepID=A0ABD0U1G5_DENTH
MGEGSAVRVSNDGVLREGEAHGAVAEGEAGDLDGGDVDRGGAGPEEEEEGDCEGDGDEDEEAGGEGAGGDDFAAASAGGGVGSAEWRREGVCWPRRREAGREFVHGRRWRDPHGLFFVSQSCIESRLREWRRVRPYVTLEVRVLVGNLADLRRLAEVRQNSGRMSGVRMSGLELVVRRTVGPSGGGPANCRAFKWWSGGTPVVVEEEQGGKSCLRSLP